jgi:RNA polymerase sigma-70 factor (ECF subfamily)
LGVAITAEKELTDRELVLSARAANGEGAFRKLYERHGPDVLAFLAHLLRDDALSEDVLQEAFLRAHGALESYDEERSFRAWLFGIARNVAVDALRMRAKTERIAEEKARRGAATVPSPCLEVERREEAEQARVALAALPPEARAILVQRHGLDMKIAELAESLAVTEKTATARLRAALVRFTEALMSARGGS